MSSNESKQLIQTTKEEQQPILLTIAGYVMALISMVLTTTASGCAQGLGGTVPGFQRNIYRFVTQFLLGVSFVAFKRLNVRVEWKIVPYIIVDCIALAVLNWTYYAADAYLPTSTIGCVNVTVALVLVSVISGVVLKEFEWQLAVSASLCLTGVFLVTQPHFIFTSVPPVIIYPLCDMDTEETIVSTLGPSANNTLTRPDNTSLSYLMDDVVEAGNGSELFGIETKGKTGNLIYGYTYASISGLSYVVFMYCTNKRLKEIHPFVTLFWISVFGIIFSVMGMFIFETPMLPSDDLCLGLMVGNAVGAGSCIIFVLISLTLLPARVFAVIITFEIVLMCTAQYTVLYKINSGHRNATEVVGVVVVLVGNLMKPLHDLYLEMNQGKRTEGDSGLERVEHLVVKE